MEDDPTVAPSASAADDPIGGIEGKMAGNLRNRTLAFEAAEAALRDAGATMGDWSDAPIATLAPLTKLALDVGAPHYAIRAAKKAARKASAAPLEPFVPYDFEALRRSALRVTKAPIDIATTIDMEVLAKKR